MQTSVAATSSNLATLLPTLAALVDRTRADNLAPFVEVHLQNAHATIALYVEIGAAATVAGSFVLAPNNAGAQSKHTFRVRKLSDVNVIAASAGGDLRVIAS